MKVASASTSLAAALIGAFQEEGVIGGAQRIGDMAEIDLVLAGRVLRGSTLGRQRLGLAIAGKAGEESVLLVERIQAVELAGMAPSRPHPGGAAGAPGRRGPAAARADRTRARARRPAAGRGRRTGPRPGRAARADRRTTAAPSASPSPASTCAPPARQGTGAKVDGSTRHGRSAIALLPDQARRVDIGAGRIHAVERARKAQARRRARRRSLPPSSRLPRAMPTRSGRIRSTVAVAGMALEEACQAARAGSAASSHVVTERKPRRRRHHIRRRRAA